MRPLGALIFGHIGDTAGRNRCLLLSILAMAFSTVTIGILPTYNFGKYRAGVAAPVLLALLRLLQGLAMGGEFGSAVIYISELARRSRRGTFVAILQMSVNAGMILATLLVILLQNTLTEKQMLRWGWRVPFLCAFATALLGAFLRRGMPEPHAFLTAARAARARHGDGDAKAGATATGHPASTTKDTDGGGDTASRATGSMAPSERGYGDDDLEPEDLEEVVEPKGALAALHGSADVRTPIMRLIRNNLMGLLLHICFMAWVSGAFYVTVSWLAKDLRTYGYPLLQTQGLLIVSLIPNAIGLLVVGNLIDRGVRAIWLNAIIVIIGSALGFAVFKSVGKSLPAAWGIVCLFHLFIGGAMANVALPCTRIYEPLQRTTGFSFGYNAGYGVIGGLSPLAVAAIKAGLPLAMRAFAPAFWLLALGAISIVGCLGLNLYAPRLGRPFVGRLE